MDRFFIGRETELETIKSLLLSNQDRHLIRLSGEGGVGKTLLALKALEIIDEEELKNVTTAYVDFDLPANRAMRTVRSTIAKAFTGKFLDEYLELLDELQAIENEEVASYLKEKSNQRVDLAFNDVLINGAKNKRLFLIIDTVEKIRDGHIEDDLFQLLGKLTNVVVIYSGRKDALENENLDEIYGDICYTDLEINKFDLDLTGDFIDKMLGDILDKEIKEKIWLLTAGKPILLTLAVTWIGDEYIELLSSEADNKLHVNILQKSIDELNQDIEKYRDEFEFEVVDGVRALQSPLDWAVFYMALMDHPASIELWQLLLGIEKENAEEIIEYLKLLPFVRLDLTMHDEMRDLVKKHVWPYVGTDDTMQKEAIRKMLSYCQEEMEKLQGWDRWLREAEETHYLLSLEIEDGYKKFIEKFDQALDDSLELCELLLETILSKEHMEQLSANQRREISIGQAQLLNHLGKKERAEKIITRVLGDPAISDEEKAEAFSTMAYRFRNSNPQVSISYYEQALDILKELGDREGVAKALNWAGQVYRRAGETDKAIAYFEKSIEECDELDLVEIKANAMNNLAYVYRQLGVGDKAINLARFAYVLREKLGDELGLAFSNQTIGEIYRDRKDHKTANIRFLEARDTFKKYNRDQDIAHININLANLARKDHRPGDVERYLDESLTIFKQSGDLLGEADALNEYGCEYRKRAREVSRSQKDYESAETIFEHSLECLEKSAEISIGLKNWYRVADNFADLTLLYRYWFENAQWENEISKAPDEDKTRDRLLKAQEYAYKAILISRKYKFSLTESRALEALGDIYYAKGEYVKAFTRFYLPACSLMAEHYQKTIWRYHLIFDRVHRKIINLEIPENDVRLIAGYMSRRWKEKRLNEIAPEFSDLYEEISQEWHFSGAI
ncbi:tetratricopeptide repeat protein [Chloroflexota bacterium]